MRTVLVIDQHATARSYQERLLSEHGFNVRRLTHLDEVFSAAEPPMADLIVVRAAMPEGLALLQQLRAAPATAGLPIIVIAREASAARVRQQALLLGADEYLRERTSGAEMLARVHSLLRRTRSADSQSWEERYLPRLMEIVGTSGSGLPGLAELLSEWAVRASQQEIAAIWLLKHDELVCVARSGGVEETRELDQRHRLADVTLFRQALASGTPLYGPLADPHEVLAGLRWASVTPLISQSEPVGLLVVGRGAAGEPAPEALSAALSTSNTASILAIALQNARLSEAMQQQQDLLQDFDRQKDEFMSLVSHELNNPMAAIKGYTELLRRRAQRDPQLLEQFRGVDKIEQQVSRLGHLLDMLLTASRISMGRLAIQPRLRVDVVEVVEQAVGNQQEQTDRHQLLLRCEEPSIECECDAARIAQAVNYLLGNAIKFSPEGGNVRVTVQREAEQAVLTISDQGVGIPAEEISRLGQRFARASNVANWFAGVGLGLYIARHIVERHGGTIELSSEEGHGTTVTLRLPVSVGALRSSSPASTTSELQ